MVDEKFRKFMKKGLVGLSLLGATLFNPLNAQENYKAKDNNLIEKVVQIENEGGKTPHYYVLEEKTLENLIDNSKKYILNKGNYNFEEIKKISENIHKDIQKKIPEVTKDSLRILPQVRAIDPENIYASVYLAIGEKNNLHFHAIKNEQGKLLIMYDRDGTHDFSNAKDQKNYKDLIIIPSTGKVQTIQKYLIDIDNSLREVSDSEILSIAKKTRDKKLSIKNYTPKYNTLAHQMLQIEDSVLIPFPSYKTLDLLIDNSKNYIEPKEKYSREELEQIVKKVDEDIMEKIPSLETDSLGRPLFPIKGNKNCYRKTLIYLAIGEENKIPFYAFPLPGHIAIRYDPDGKHNPLNPIDPVNKGDLNIETTRGEVEKGFKHSDESYRKENILEKEYLAKNILLRNMTKDQLFADAYISRILPYISRQKGADFEENVPYEVFHPSHNVITDCNKAIRLSPNEARNYFVRGKFEMMINGPTENPEAALKDINKALELNENPNYFLPKIIALSALKREAEWNSLEKEKNYYEEEIFKTSNQALNSIKRLRNEFQLEKLNWGEDLQNYRLWKIEKTMTSERVNYFESKKDFVSEKKEKEKLNYLEFEHKYAKLNETFFMFGLDYNF